MASATTTCGGRDSRGGDGHRLGAKRAAEPAGLAHHRVSVGNVEGDTPVWQSCSIVVQRPEPADRVGEPLGYIISTPGWGGGAINSDAGLGIGIHHHFVQRWPVGKLLPLRRLNLPQEFGRAMCGLIVRLRSPLDHVDETVARVW
jgi:hypothetical protein